VNDFAKKDGRYPNINDYKEKRSALRNMPPKRRAAWIGIIIAIPMMVLILPPEDMSRWSILGFLIGGGILLVIMMLGAPMDLVTKILPLSILVIAFFVFTGFIGQVMGSSSPNRSFVAGAAILLIIFIMFRPRELESVKDKPDHLGDEVGEAVVNKLSDTTGVWSGNIGGKDLFASIEDRGIVLGPPGAGKTAFLVSQLLKWAETKRSFVCFDSKPEIFGITREALNRLGYRTLVYNPTANQGQRYNPLTDIDSPEAIGELAAALIPSDDAAANIVFTESARDLLDAIISHLRAVDGEASLPSIRSIVGSVDGYKGLLQDLVKSPDPDAVDIARSLAMTAANQRLLGSILGTLRANLRFLRYPNIGRPWKPLTSPWRISQQISPSPCSCSLKSISEKPRRTCLQP